MTRSSLQLSGRQRYALHLLEKHGPEGTIADSWSGVVDGRPWIHERVCVALETAGYVYLDRERHVVYLRRG